MHSQADPGNESLHPVTIRKPYFRFFYLSSKRAAHPPQPYYLITLFDLYAHAASWQQGRSHCGNRTENSVMRKKQIR